MPGSKPLGQTFGLTSDGLNVTVLVEDKPLAKLLDKIANPGAAMKLIGAAMMELVDQSFDTSTSPDGRPWLPLFPATIERREHGGDQPLRDTGVLQHSFGATVVEGGQAVSIGTNFGFYTYHQHDPDYPIDKHVIPIRNVLPIKHQPLPDSWRSEILATLHDYLEPGGAA